MAARRFTRAHVHDLEGFQHADDDYWFQPVVLGTNLFTYVASVPPGGIMLPHGHEEDPYELSLFQIDGTLQVTLEDETFAVSPGDAIHIQPGVSLGVHNTGSRTARFVLTFNPPPKIESVAWLRQRFAERGRPVKSAEEMRRLLAEAGGPPGGAMRGGR